MISLYFHIPFCTRKCPYCHFFVLRDNQDQIRAFIDSLKKEWNLKLSLFKNTPITSIYFGGGTPSKLKKNELNEIFSLFDPLILEKDCEITFELNPEDVTEEYLSHLKSLKINRLSLGVQSFDDAQLGTISRTHDASIAKKAIALAEDVGFTNISIDLMYDLPHQTLKSFEKTLREVKSLPIQHISLYNLIFEQESAFFRKKEKLIPLLPKEEESSKMLELAIEYLQEYGFSRYEISAFAKENNISKHNTGYWQARPFIGFGPSAFSYWNHSRIKNIANLKKYHDLLNLGKEPVEFTETLDPESRQKELFAVELRMFKGVNLPSFEKKEGKLFPSLKKSINELIEEGLLDKKINTYSLSERGKLFYDTVGERII